MSFQLRIAACNNYEPSEFVPFSIDNQAVGRIRPAVADMLLELRHLFHSIPDGGVSLGPGISGFDTRSAAMAEAVAHLAAHGRVQGPIGESYPVTAGDRESALCVVDRSAGSCLGIQTFGQHLNGYVRKTDGLHMWVGRRAADRRLFPGRLDQLVAGGLPHGVTLEENLVKECHEEAGMEPKTASRAEFVGSIRYFAQTEKGAKPDMLFCYDLELPEDFVPRCTDGEVEAFYLMPIGEVVERCRDTEEFKPNCSLVVLDFLLRHQLLNPAEYSVEALQKALHAPLLHA